MHTNEPALSIPATAAGHPWRGYFLIAAATLCWGATATFGKAIFNGTVVAGPSRISPLVLSQTRTTFSFLLLTPFLLLRYGRKFFTISRKDLGLCALVGTLGLTGSNFFYYLAIQKGTVAVAIILQYTAPVWVLLYMVLRGRQKATLQRVSAVMVVMVGIVLTTGLFHSGITLNPVAVGAALLASFSFAFYNIAAQGLVSGNHPLKIMAFVLGGAAAFWLVVNPPWRLAAQHYTAEQWAALFVFSCFSILLPYTLYLTGLKYLDPTRAVVTSCLEPVFAIVLAGMFVHETPRPLQMLGIVAVLGATILVQVQRKSAPATETQ